MSLAAQPIPDTTLSNNSSVIPSPDPAQDLQIVGGTLRGTSLFHSFLDFDIAAGQSVYFANPPGIETILSRVTGPSSSDLSGTLGVAGLASLYFLNPNGIVLGPNAQLDINGSFVATTAQTLDWGNGLQFSAATPQDAPLLNVNLQPGLQYGDGNGSISSQAQLEVGRNLQLAAGQLTLEGELKAGGNLLLQATDDASLDAIRLFTTVEASDIGAAGDITLEAKNINVTGQSVIKAEGLGDGDGGNVAFVGDESIFLSSPPPGDEPASRYAMFINTSSSKTGNAGKISFTAPDITLTNVDAIARLNEDATGRAGDIEAIATNRIFTSEATDFFTESSGNGPAGDITLKAQDIQLTGGTEFFTKLKREGTGRSGDIFVTAETAELTDKTKIFSDSEGKGRAGNMTFRVTDLTLSGGTQLWPRRLSRGEGDSGDILIEGNSVTMTEGARMFTDTKGKGDGGDVTFNLTGPLVMKGGSRVATGGSADGIPGLLTFNVGSIEVEKSFITSRVTRKGGVNGPDRDNGIVVNATGDASFIAGGLFTDPRERANAGGASGGDIIVNAQNIEVAKNGRIQAGSIGLAGGGQIQLNAVDTVRIANQGWVLNRAGASATGNSKSLELRGQRVEIIDRGKVESSTQAKVNGGDVIVIAPEVLLKNQGQILADASESGNAGDIDIVADASLTIVEDSVVSSGVFGGSGNGGNITVKTPWLTLASGGRIEALTKGVNFRLLAEELLEQDQSYREFIEASEPIAYWTLDETTAGVAPNRVGDARFNGTYEGNVDPTVPGISGTAAKFDGENGAIRINDSLDLDNTSFAIEAWVKLEPEDQPRQQVFFSAHTDNSRHNSLHLRAYDDESALLGLWSDDLRTPNGQIPADGQWHHVVARVFFEPGQGSLAGDSSTRLDIDGVEAAVGSKGPFEGKDAVSLIGAWRSATDQTFNGSIDEVAVYKLDNNIPTVSEAGGGSNLFDRNYVAGLLSQGASLESFDALSNQAESGSITIEADVVNISGVSERPSDRNIRDADFKGISSGLFSGADGDFTGAGGQIKVTANQVLNVSDGGILSSTTTGQADAGSIDVTAGEINLTRGGQFLTTSSSSGRAGIIEARARRINISGFDPLFDQRVAASEAEGIDRIDVEDRFSGIFSQATGADAVEQSSVQGGNIILTPERLLVLRRGGKIATNSQSLGNGGNITINNQGGFIVALPDENSDITANATRGDGGNIQIETQGLFGIEFRQQATAGSDITASSDFGLNGSVTVNVLNIDPSQGLAELPEALADSSDQISQSCTAQAIGQNSFVRTGRGGVPISPDAPLRSQVLASPWIPTETAVADSRGANTGRAGIGVEGGSITAIRDAADQSLTQAGRGRSIMEAQAWTMGTGNNVKLVMRQEQPLNLPKVESC